MAGWIFRAGGYTRSHLVLHLLTPSGRRLMPAGGERLTRPGFRFPAVEHLRNTGRERCARLPPSAQPPVLLKASADTALRFQLLGGVSNSDEWRVPSFVARQDLPPFCRFLVLLYRDGRSPSPACGHFGFRDNSSSPVGSPFTSPYPFLPPHLLTQRVVPKQRLSAALLYVRVIWPCKLSRNPSPLVGSSYVAAAGTRNSFSPVGLP